MSKIIEMYLGEEWYSYLKDEFKKEYILSLSNKIKNDRRVTTVYPETPAGVFNVFRNLQPSKIKCVIVGQD